MLDLSTTGEPTLEAWMREDGLCGGGGDHLQPLWQVLDQQGASGTVYGFTGEQEDSATGLLYLRARYYNPSLKTFMSRDPWSGDRQIPMSYHAYMYAYGNPTFFTDPSGYDGVCFQQRRSTPAKADSPLRGMCEQLAKDGYFGPSGEYEVFANHHEGGQDVVEWLEPRQKRYPDETFIVVGYSWGGGGAIEFVWYIREVLVDNEVDALILINAVGSFRYGNRVMFRCLISAISGIGYLQMSKLRLTAMRQKMHTEIYLP